MNVSYHEIPSKTLDLKKGKIGLYIPPEAEKGGLFPCIYLLHGTTDDEKKWFDDGDAVPIARDLLEQGLIPPVIISTMHGANSFYINGADGGQWEDFMLKEWIPWVENNAPADPEKRCLEGFSMGGFGTMKTVLRNEGVFRSAVGHAVASRQAEPPERLEYWHEAFGDPVDVERYRQNNPASLVKAGKVEALRKTRFRFDSGSEDSFLEIGIFLHEELEKLKVPHEWEIFSGMTHNWQFIRVAARKGFMFHFAEQT